MNDTYITLFIIGALLVGGVVGYVLTPQETIIGLSETEVSARVSTAVDDVTTQKDAEIVILEKRIENLQSGTDDEVEDEVDEANIFEYIVDGLYLNTLLEGTYSDREVKDLFDGEIKFDGDNYDAEETLIIKDIKLLANGDDFEGNIYMTALEGAIEYKLTFENSLNTSLINEDETLEFNFLGDSYEVSEWDSDTITLTKGEKHKLLVGESITIGDKEVVFNGIDSTGEQASMTIGGEDRVFEKDDVKTVNDLEIKMETIFDGSELGQSYINIVVGEDIEVEIQDSNKYIEDSIWNWKISSNSIGIILNEAFTEVDLDNDEKFQAIGVGEEICLPNGYECLTFNGMDSYDTEEYNLELDTKSGLEYVEINGEFQSGTSDYSRVYVNATGIYSDEDLELINKTEIELGDTDSVLIINATGLFFEDFEVNFDLNVTNIGTGDENYFTDFGVLIEDVEDAVDSQEFTIFVPEDGRIEGSITISQISA